jgi:hypothetical protein
MSLPISSEDARTVRQRIRTVCAGVVWGLLGYLSFFIAAGLLDSLPLNAKPEPMGSIATGLAWLLPGVAHMAWRFDRNGTKGFGWVLFGVLLGLAIPLGLFMSLAWLVGPLLPRG